MIFKRLFRWQYWRWRSKYWRHRAIKAEKQLAAEMWRDRERSDILASASIRAIGMFGLEPRTAPAVVKQPRRSIVPASYPGTDQDGFTYADRMEFEMMWWPDAQAAGVSLRDAKTKFLQEVIIPRRSPLNDEPLN